MYIECMASKYTTNELVLEGPADESDSEDDFDGYVNDDNTSVKSQQHDCEDDHFDGYVNDDNTECISQQHDYEDDQEKYRRYDNDSENEEDDDENDVQSEGVMSYEFLSLPDFSGYYSCSKDMSNKTPIDFFEFQFTDDIVD